MYGDPRPGVERGDVLALAPEPAGKGDIIGAGLAAAGRLLSFETIGASFQPPLSRLGGGGGPLGDLEGGVFPTGGGGGGTIALC